MKSLKVGPNGVVSLVAQDITEIFTPDNCLVVFRADGSYQSWKPDRTINAFDTLEVGIGYIAIMKTILEVTDVFSEGLPAGGVGFDYGVIISNTSSKSVNFEYFNNSTDLEAGFSLDPGTFRIVKTTDYPVGATIIKAAGDITALETWEIGLINNEPFAASGGGPSDLSELAGILKVAVTVYETNQALKILNITDKAAPVNHFYFSNLSGDSLNIVKGSNHAEIVQTVANNGVWVATKEDFLGEDDLSIIPGGTDYKAVLIQTNFSHTTSTLKYQVAAAGIQQIPAFYLDFDNLILVFLPDASGAGTWT